MFTHKFKLFNRHSVCRKGLSIARRHGGVSKYEISQVLSVYISLSPASPPSAWKRLRVCQRVATVSGQPSQTFAAPMEHACACGPARGAPPGRPPSDLTSRWRGGAGEGNFQRGHGRETGRRWRVGSREKWLYFSYTPPFPTCISGGNAQSPASGRPAHKRPLLRQRAARCALPPPAPYGERDGWESGRRIPFGWHLTSF